MNFKRFNQTFKHFSSISRCRSPARKCKHTNCEDLGGSCYEENDMAFCDYCAGSPCQAGEQCVSGSSGFTCVQQPLDYCASSPCQNGGTCTNEASGFSCACEPGFGGPICAGSVCPLIYSPVCGNDDVTYANDCLMSAASVSLQCHGPCPCPTVAGTTAGEY